MTKVRADVRRGNPAQTRALIQNHFNQERGLYCRQNFNANRAAALAEWHGFLAA